MRTVVAAAVACLSIAGLSLAADVQASIKKDISIPAGGLGPALRALSEERRIHVVFISEDVNKLATQGASGSLTVDEALSQLLKGTGLTFQHIDDETVSIVPIAAAPATTRAPDTSVGANTSSFSSPNENVPTKPTDEGPKGFWQRFRLARADQGTSSGSSSAENNAQSSDKSSEMRTTLEEIIVTAQKREQNLIDVPISITAISGERLAEEGIRNAQDLSFAIPGMATQEIGPGRQIITIRGLGSQKGSSSLTGVYLDEMSVSGLQDDFVSTYIDLRTTDLARVEVLKGPQGTLFGEGSVGGTVRFVTRDPELDRVGGNFSTSLYSNEDSGGWSEEAIGVLNLPVVKDQLGLRIAANYENTAGWIDRVQTVNGSVIDEDFNDSEVVNVRVKALWTPTDNLTVQGMAVVHSSEGGGSNIVNLEPREESNFIIEFDPTAPTGYEDDYELYNLTATYDLGSVELLSSSSYSDMKSTASLAQRRAIIPNAANPNGGFQEVLARDYELDSSSFSQELRLSSTGSEALQWVLGAYYKDIELAKRFVSGLDFFRFGQRLAPVGFQSNQQPTYKSESWAVFGNVSYALTSRWELGGGVRYFKDDRETFDALATNVAATFLSGSFDATTFRSYLSYGIADNVRLYASVSTGFRSGGFNTPGQVAQGLPPTYLPEEVTSYELGTKMRLADGRVAIEAAAFFSDYTDIQSPSQTIPTASNPVPQVFIGNPGEAEIVGFEWDVNWVVTDRLILSVSGDVTDTEFTKLNEAVTNRSFFLGDPIDFVPEYSWSFGADYGFDWTAFVPGYIRLQYNEQGEMSQTFRNIDAPVQQESTPVLHFLNASVGATWNGWGFEIFGRNLLEEDGALRPGSGLLPQARPRTVGVRFDKSF